MDGARSTDRSPGSSGAGPARPITAGTRSPSGPSGSGRISWLGSHSAGSAPPRGFGPGRLWWTTWFHFVGTGTCSSVHPTTRACASSTMTRRRPGSRRKSAEKRAKFDRESCGKLRPRGGCACGRPGRRAGRRSRSPPPTLKKFWAEASRPRCSLVCEKNSPIRKSGRRCRYAGQCETLGQPGKAPDQG